MNGVFGSRCDRQRHAEHHRVHCVHQPFDGGYYRQRHRLSHSVACITPIAVVVFCLAGGICVACNRWRPERMICAGLGCLLAVNAAIMFIQAAGPFGLRFGFAGLSKRMGLTTSQARAEGKRSVPFPDPLPTIAADRRTGRSRLDNKTMESVATRGTPREPVVAGPRAARTVFTAKSSRQAGAARRPVKTGLSKRTGPPTSRAGVEKKEASCSPIHCQQPQQTGEQDAPR